MSDTESSAESPSTLPPAVDPVQFARGDRRLAGDCEVARLERLVSADVAPQGRLSWSVQGAMLRDDLDRVRPFLDVAVAFSPRMTCVRCLEPVDVPAIDVVRRFRLAASEQQAEREDRDVDDVDVIAAAPRLSLAELVEDEALLALPMAPAHDACTAAGDLAAAAGFQKH